MARGQKFMCCVRNPRNINIFVRVPGREDSGARPGGSVTGVTEKLFMCQMFMCLFRPLLSSADRQKKRPAERGHVKKRLKVSKIFFSTLFVIFRTVQKKGQKSSKIFFDNFRAAPNFRPFFWGALISRARNATIAR